MNLTLQTAPCNLKKVNLLKQKHGEDQIKAFTLHVKVNTSRDALSAIHYGLGECLGAVWDNEGQPRIGLAQMKFSTEFEDTFVELVFGRSKVKLNDCKLKKFVAKPLPASSVELAFQVGAVSTEGEVDKLHSMMEADGVTLSFDANGLIPAEPEE